MHGNAVVFLITKIRASGFDEIEVSAVTKYHFAGTQHIATLAPHIVCCSASVWKSGAASNKNIAYMGEQGIGHFVYNLIINVAVFFY